MYHVRYLLKTPPPSAKSLIYTNCLTISLGINLRAFGEAHSPSSNVHGDNVVVAKLPIETEHFCEFVSRVSQFHYLLLNRSHNHFELNRLRVE